MQSRNVQRRDHLDVLYEGGSACAVRRNPYLVEFEAQRSRVNARRRPGHTPDARQRAPRGYAGEESAVRQRGPRGYAEENTARQQSPRGYAGEKSAVRQRGPRGYAEESAARQRGPKRCAGDAYAGRSQGRRQYGEDVRTAGRGDSNGLYIWEEPDVELKGGADVRRNPASPRPASARRAMTRRRRRALMQRALVSVWICCILVLAATLLIKNGRASAGQESGGQPKENQEADAPQYSGYMVQGLPAEEFAKHPAWTEDFLTVNEYSRPGDPLGSVKNIFVHYTANPGTSAAQNRSYFEWLKDTHETSASAHFIIGYEGEIIQCVPLDEIAYAVQSRNGDSVSIECCYLKADGSFTQETYDSLISLLRWLVDVYDLETDDILRHYDCGGKKCPLYYTDNPDEWEELKKDVDKL